MNKNLKPLALSLSLLVGAASTPAQQLLKVGDPAPPMKVAAWLKGTPVTAFQKGTVYLLDFWATWCGPCNASFPHMSEVAKEFAGRAVVIGVDVSENTKAGEDLRSTLAEFIKGKGDKMAYNICMDDPKSAYMMKSWMTAAAEPGIPCVFIVDQNGTLADVVEGYSGESDHRVDDTVSKLLDGTFDRDAAVSRFAKSLTERQASIETGRALRPIYAAIKAKEYSLALHLLDAAAAKNPRPDSESAGIMTSIRYVAQLHLNPDKAYEMAVSAKDSKDAVSIARVFAGQLNLPKKFYEYAIDVFEAERASKTEGWKFDVQTLAAAYSLAGNPAKAAEEEQSFLEAIIDLEKGKESDPTVQKYLDGVRAKIKEYQDAAKKSNS